MIELYHRSQHLFDFPSYSKIKEHCDLNERHEKSLLGLWTTSLSYVNMGDDFGDYLYKIILPPDAKVLDLSESSLKKLYDTGYNTQNLREQWKDYDVVVLDEMEQIVLKFDNIDFERINTV